MKKKIIEFLQRAAYGLLLIVFVIITYTAFVFVSLWHRQLPTFSRYDAWVSKEILGDEDYDDYDY